MEGPVCLQSALARKSGLLHRSAQGQNVINFLVRCPPAGHRRHARLKQQAGLQQVLEAGTCRGQLFKVTVVPRMNLGGHKSAPSPVNDQNALGSQNMNRLPQRCAADVQLCCQLIFIGQLLARGQYAVSDHFVQRIRRLLREISFFHIDYLLCWIKQGLRDTCIKTGREGTQSERT